MTDEHEIRKIVRKSYAKVVEEGCGCCGPNSSCCGGATTAEQIAGKVGYSTDEIHAVPDGANLGLGCGCCGPSSCYSGAETAEQISGKIGYSTDEIHAVPDGANLGLGCGNPLAHAAIHEGDTILDLGSGAGFDCFLAARKVGNTGRVIGVDMTPEMLARARQNAKKAGITNVEFRLGEIESLPVADYAVDLIISNCVINLSPDKARVFSEAFRVLKPGGTLMISDIVLERDLPGAVLSSVAAYVGCLAGAVQKEVYLDLIRGAGFSDVEVLEESTYPIELMVNDPTAQAVLVNLSIPKEELRRIGDSVRSVKVRAVKRK